MATATVAGLEGLRTEEKKFEYFSSINSMARKIMQEREKIKAQHGSTWEKMSPQEQDCAIDSCMMDPHIRARYAMHRVERDEVACYPKLLLHTGQKMVHFGEEDITWQDEHSAPFSWETKSQLEFSLTPGSADQGVSASQTEPKSAKAPHSSQMGPKVTVSEGRRPEEESSFWKISAESSNPTRKAESAQAPRPQPPAPITLSAPPVSISISSKPPPPVSISISSKPPPPVSISISSKPAPPLSVSSSVAGWERSQSTLPSVSNTLDEMISSNLISKPANIPTRVERQREVEAPPNPDLSPTFCQFNTSNNILKTGFDFLDNW
ncbi:unnamed protein product [Pleuronectes platessa]|uniref:DUF4706 domain-containing protein n=1 Tax=Pleuronectes platessa TaxID=8262 RepID=A0A9N7TSI7_PLEPL|nr:unnamed protein product [Pleuronectes platessa]